MASEGPPHDAVGEELAQLQLFFLRNSGLPVMPRLPQEMLISRGMESCTFKSCMSFVVGKELVFDLPRNGELHFQELHELRYL